VKVMLVMWSDGSYTGNSAEDYRAWTDYESGLRADGVYADAGQFRDTESGRVVITRLAGGGSEAGPVVPSGGSTLSGYYLLDCDSLEDATEYARRAPLYGSVEIRQLVEF
jgi:hypothetical protein